MAKRFIDTGLFDDEWFAELDKDCKLFWLYFLTKCDHAGLLKVNKKLIEFQTGINSLERVIEHFADRIITVNGLFFCYKFIEFQYPGFPKSKVRQQEGAISILAAAGIWDLKTNSLQEKFKSLVRVSKELPNSYVYEHDNVSGNGSVSGVLQNSPIVFFNAEEEILKSKIRFEQICMAAGAGKEQAKESLHKYHLYLEEKEQYPKPLKSLFAGFEKWLINEKKFSKNDTSRKIDTTNGNNRTSKSAGAEQLLASLKEDLASFGAGLQDNPNEI